MPKQEIRYILPSIEIFFPKYVLTTYSGRYYYALLKKFMRFFKKISILFNPRLTFFLVKNFQRSYKIDILLAQGMAQNFWMAEVSSLYIHSLAALDISHPKKSRGESSDAGST